MGSPSEILTDYYKKILVDRDTPSALLLWTDETKLYYPGHHCFSGVHIGVAWVTDVYHTAIRAGGGTMKKEKLLSPIVGDDEYALSHYYERLTMNEPADHILMERRCLYGFAHGRIATVRIFDSEPERVDHFFNRYYQNGSTTVRPAAGA